jgi:hypothetical protein
MSEFKYQVFVDGVHRASFKHSEDAAVFVASVGEDCTVYCEGWLLWSTAVDDDINDIGYDEAADTMMKRWEEFEERLNK